jgi:hypothetical protein
MTSSMQIRHVNSLPITDEQYRRSDQIEASNTRVSGSLKHSTIELERMTRQLTQGTDFTSIELSPVSSRKMALRR